MMGWGDPMFTAPEADSLPLGHKGIKKKKEKKKMMMTTMM